MHFGVPPTRVYEALDTDSGRAAFWAESAAETEGIIEYHFIEGTVWAGRILERRAPELWAVDYFGGEARFELHADGAGGTDLLLTHRDVPEDEWNAVHAGWLNVLFALKGWLEHGIDLRNHDPERSWVQGYADQ